MRIPSIRSGTGLAASALLLLAAGVPASAQISVDATATWQSGNANLGGTFDASASDKLVFVVTGEHGFNQTANGTIGDVFYDGVQLSEGVLRAAIKANAGPPQVLVDDTWNAIFYLDNPGSVHTSGTITTSGFASRGSVAVIALSGTDPGIGNTVIGPRDSNVASLSTSAGSIVIGSYGLGGTGNTAQLAPITTPLWDAEVARQENGNNWDGHVVAYQNNVAAGTTDCTFDDTTTPAADGRTGRHVIAAEFLAAPPDTTAPTLAPTDIVDDQAGGPISDTTTVTYTVTFSESMDAASIGIDDFENGGSPAATIDSVTGSGDTYTVTVTPGLGNGTLQLQVAAGAVITDKAGNPLDTTAAIADDTTITVNADTTAPTLAPTGIVDDKSGGPIFDTATVVYTVTFSEAMDASTVEVTDFGNAGSPAATIDSVSPTGDPAVFEVTVTPGTGDGTLQLQVNAGAVLTDLAGNALDTAAAIADDTVINVQEFGGTTATMSVDFQSTIASEQHPDYPGEARYYHVSVNPDNPGTGSYAATIVGTNDPAPVFVRNYDGEVLSYKFVGGTNNDISGVAAEGGNPALITYATEDTSFDGFGQGQAKIWDMTDPGADLATGGADPFNVNTNDKSGGGYRSFGGATGTIDISGISAGSVHIYYGAFSAKPSVSVVMKDTDGPAPDITIPNAHLNDDTANRTEYYLAEIDFVTDGFYDVIEYTWLANGTDYSGNGRGLGTVLTGPPVVGDYGAWAALYPDADLSDPDADFDGDGLTNNEERLFGLNPTDPASQNPYVVGLDAGAGTFSFTRRDPALTGLFTDIETSTDLQTWTVDEGAMLSVTGPDANGVETVAVTLSPALLSAPELYVRVNQNDGIILSENFEMGDGGFTVSTDQGSAWALGTPASTGIGGSVTEGNGSSATAWGTDIGNPGFYLDPTTTKLRSPVIDLTGVAGAQLTFAEALDLEAGDSAVVNVIDDTTDTVIAAAIYTADDSASQTDANWNAVGPIDLTPYVGQAIRIEWSFNGLGGTTDDYLGWYVDDVSVAETMAP